MFVFIYNFKWIEDRFTYFLYILELYLFYLLSKLRGEKPYLQVRMSSIDCDEFDTDFLNSASNAVKDNWKNQDNSSAPSKMFLRSRKKDFKPPDDPIQIDLDCTITPPSSPLTRGPDTNVPLPTNATTSFSSRVSTLIFLNKTFCLPIPPRHTLVLILPFTVNHDS